MLNELIARSNEAPGSGWLVLFMLALCIFTPALWGIIVRRRRLAEAHDFEFSFAPEMSAAASLLFPVMLSKIGYHHALGFLIQSIEVSGPQTKSELMSQAIAAQLHTDDLLSAATITTTTLMVPVLVALLHLRLRQFAPRIRRGAGLGIALSLSSLGALSVGCLLRSRALGRVALQVRLADPEGRALALRRGVQDALLYLDLGAAFALALLCLGALVLGLTLVRAKVRFRCGPRAGVVAASLFVLGVLLLAESLPFADEFALPMPLSRTVSQLPDAPGVSPPSLIGPSDPPPRSEVLTIGPNHMDFNGTPVPNLAVLQSRLRDARALYVVMHLGVAAPRTLVLAADRSLAARALVSVLKIANSVGYADYYFAFVILGPPQHRPLLGTYVPRNESWLAVTVNEDETRQALRIDSAESFDALARRSIKVGRVAQWAFPTDEESCP